MADFKAMYLRLFRHVTNAIGVLQTAQLEAEEAYTESDDEVVYWPSAPVESEDDGGK